MYLNVIFAKPAKHKKKSFWASVSYHKIPQIATFQQNTLMNQKMVCKLLPLE